MIKKGAILLGTTALLLGSCIEHEVIPPPEPTVDLYANFIGEIGGANVELTEYVLGYENSSTKSKIINPAPPSYATYYSQMTSPSSLTSVQIGMGSILFNSNVDADPDLSAFNGFCSSLADPGAVINYAAPGSDDGFVFNYVDGTGRQWYSSGLSTNPQNAEFTGMTLESDASGDYAMFVCNFDCYIYSLNPDSLALMPPKTHLDSIQVTDAIYHAWFRR